MSPLFLPLLATLATAFLSHPHVPKAITLGGAAGKVTCTYFTVPFNAEHLKGLKPAFRWHLGYANLETEVPLACGSVTVPPGKYKLDVRLVEGTGDDAKWEAVFRLAELARAQAAVGRGRRAGPDAEKKAKEELEALEKRLKDAGTPGEIAVPTTGFKAESNEHLVISACSEGFEAVARGSTEPNGGLKFSLRFGWGELHRELALEETFAKKAATSQPTKR